MQVLRELLAPAKPVLVDALHALFTSRGDVMAWFDAHVTEVDRKTPAFAHDLARAAIKLAYSVNPAKFVVPCVSAYLCVRAVGQDETKPLQSNEG